MSDELRGTPAGPPLPDPVVPHVFVSKGIAPGKRHERFIADNAAWDAKVKASIARLVRRPSLRHRAQPIYRAPTREEWRMDIDGWIISTCRFCREPIQRRGLFRRWRHVS